MSDPPTPLPLPPNLPYPLTITRVLAPSNTHISRGDRLLEYAFTSDTSRRELERRSWTTARKGGQQDDEARENDMVGTWEISIEGEVVRWDQEFRDGYIVERKHAGKPVVWVQKPCSHPVQLRGMCGICGADLTTDDYLSLRTSAPNSQPGPSRYPGAFELAHDALGVTVSTDEARRLETQTRDTLLQGRRLSLIVDLDQTIIHTTVDPTVGEWMAEIEEDDEREDSDPAKPSDEDEKGIKEDGAAVDEVREDTGAGSTTPPTTPRPRKQPTKKNPNAAALKDVARFQLADDLPPGYRGQGMGRWYYTKPRPGLQRFLSSMSNLYEMHVYTMGTRSYADAICSVIDPTGSTFGGRILSRDESGSEDLSIVIGVQLMVVGLGFSQKSLKRLFPTDQSMVVVIDDRSDVWADCPNLVKVVPYDFFVGIGDINGSFLPPTSPNPTSSPSSSPTAAASSTSTESPSSASSSPTPITLPELSGLIAQAKLLDQVSEERPLAKMQEELEKKGDAEEAVAVAIAINGVDVGKEDTKSKEETRSTTPPDSPTKARKPLLNGCDEELDRVADILKHVHLAFYRAYDARSDREVKRALPLGCDVELIIPDLKSRVLAGCTLVFSGVIPRHIPPETSDIWLTAEAFGVHCLPEVTKDVTHCVTATLGTEKTYRAGKIRGAKVVWVGWFWKSVALWSRQDEEDFLAGQSGLASTSGPNTPTIVVDEPTGDGLEEGNGDEDVGEEADGAGWDEDAQAELDAFLERSSDVDETEGGRTDAESVPSPPGTPSRKRVRYADEEQLPLESFKDPSPPEPGASPPKKKRALHLGPPENGEVPEMNRFQSRAPKGKERIEEVSSRDEVGADRGGDGDGGGNGNDDDDEGDFAQMLMDSLADGGGDED